MAELAIKRLVLMFAVCIAWAVVLPIMKREEGQSIREVLNFKAIILRLLELCLIGMFCMLISYACIDVYHSIVVK